ncbi:MAG: GNAT family N-acetyltransferase [Betaproteobacteria bacterium]
MSDQPLRIRCAADDADIARVRVLFVEYQQWLGVSLCFQGFEQELASLPGGYASPRGRLLLLAQQDDAGGCIALRPLENLSAEVKRLYVRPEWQGQGWGRHLVAAVIADARAIGYRSLKLDTLAHMEAARALYADVGFRVCAPYYDNPLPDAIYMELAL